ncbi:DNA sulfur modification protein DndD [Ornithobacterium rhinotracheale]|uniref:DNA sulfur modification protein DndD n=1 Tax=Ornithobacterium rhinotracheale TaxID=28251 RepID=UPI00129C5628|nr:DNA sulfur modification protein DndD [Ornithobacterium rhinotracheale]MRJ11570.1 DNA sulfur modification protein DndD [Ornithobacterium rhinotracheale]
MKISKITISNFRQYLDSVELSLETTPEKNIVLIGGRNGYGKTNLLLSIVWCLYGDKISQIDNNFKKEIQKEKNYASFMQQSLNSTAFYNGKNDFSVSLNISDVDLPNLNNINDIVITRSFNVDSKKEILSIRTIDDNKELFEDIDDKYTYINDFIIPIDAAKFVFFDAEKIAEIANLSTKDQGAFMNDALGKILGLDIYETLIDDLKTYINSLKKEGADSRLNEQIKNIELSVEIKNAEIEKIEEIIATLNKKIDESRKKIRDLDSFISKHTNNGGTKVDRDSLITDIENLKSKKNNLNEKFNDISEVIPLVILTGKLNEVKEQIKEQENAFRTSILNKENLDKIDKLIDDLFNRPPEPENSSMTFKDKAFYYNKAKNLCTKYFNENDLNDLDFEFDLTNSDKKLIYDSINLIETQSVDYIEQIVRDVNNIDAKIDKIQRELSHVEAGMEDELVLDYISKKSDEEQKTQDLFTKIGENNNKINNLKEQIKTANKKLTNLTGKIAVNEMNSRKIKIANNYIEVLQKFISEQKVMHKKNLEITILNELKKLMHKLNTDSSSDNNLIEKVEVSILPDRNGMLILLLDKNGCEIKKESLSSGEKQIYISCLIKAILNESIRELPIFIDTPLGRLDEEHRDNITKNYYPELSEQVVLFSTNSEITPRRYSEIKEKVAKTYLLQNDGINTHVIDAYFKFKYYDKI